MTTQPVYKVIFQNGGQVFEVFARQIFQSDMWGFIEIEELVFGERSAVLVDPSEFAGVKRSYIPLHSVIRIDEVEKEGAVRVSEASTTGSKVSHLPFNGIPSVPSGGDD